MANGKKVVSIGSGPAGYTAAIYAARANLKPNLVSGIQPGGQLTITTDGENYPGDENTIQGPWLMEQMQKQSLLGGTKIINSHVEKIELNGEIKKLYLDSGEVIDAKAVIICTGAQARRLNIENEQKLQGHGLSAGSEEHTSELQYPCNLVCSTLLEKKTIMHRSEIAYKNI